MSDWSSGIDAAARELWSQLGTVSEGDAAAVIRAFLSVQPSIRWCSVHNKEAVDDEFALRDECWWIVWSDEPDGDYNLCRIVERKLVGLVTVS